MDSEFNGFRQVHEAFGKGDDALRQVLVDKVVLPNMAYLRNGNTMAVGQQGWYAAVSPTGLRNKQLAPDPFPVPPECRTWHDRETDQRDGLCFRFFNKRAWLYLEPPRVSGHIEFIVPYFLMPEVLENIDIWIADVRVAWRFALNDGQSRARVIVDIPPRLFDYMQIAERVRLDIGCRITGIPRVLFKNAKDSRRLSCAVSFPRFVQS